MDIEVRGDFSGGNVGRAVAKKGGYFKAENLAGLYTFTDGNVGEAYTGIGGYARDSSGHNNHAFMLPGSTAIRTAEGIYTGDTPGRGFYFRTPIPMQTFTAIVAVRYQRIAANSGDQKYAVIFAPSYTCTGNASDNVSGVLGGDPGNGGSRPNRQDKGLFNILLDADLPDSVTDVLMQCMKANGSAPWDGPGYEFTRLAGVAPGDAWMLLGYSLNASNGRIALHHFPTGNTTVSFLSATDVSTLLTATSSFLTFGLAPLQSDDVNSTSAKGTLGVQAFWTGEAAYTNAQFHDAREAVRLTMLDRGVVAF